MNIKYDLSELEQRPPIHLKVNGDLRVNGWDQPTLEAQTPDEDPTLVMEESQVLIETNEDLTISLPHNSHLHIEAGRDASISRIEGALHISQIGGDLKIETAGAVNIASVGGDLLVRRADSFVCHQAGGDTMIEDVQTLVLDRIGGDLHIRRVEGEVNLTKIGGNLNVETVNGLTANSVGGDLHVTEADSLVCRKVGGNAKAERVQSVDLDHVGGDLTVRHAQTVSARKVGGSAEIFEVADAVAISASGDLRILACRGDIAGNARGDAQIEVTDASPMVRVNARGEIQCVIGEEVSASVRVICGGELRINSKDSNLSAQGRGVHSFQVGGGDGSISLISGGDVKVSGNARVSEIRSVTSDFSQVQQEMKELNVEMGHLNQELERMGIELGREFGSLGEKIAEKINRKLRQQFERHSRKTADKAAKGWGFHFGSPIPPVPPVPPRAPYTEDRNSEPVSEQERMLILRMVEEGKMTATEAEKLLAALEGEYPES
jgi:hypothetical protein